MMDAFRVFEVALFALVNFVPYVALSIYAFNGRTRFSKPVTYVVCSLLVFVQFLTRCWSAWHNVDSDIWISLLRLVIFLTGYAILFDVRFGKVLFIELIFANIGNFIIIAAIFLERNIFPNITHHLYCWHTSSAMFLLHLICTIPFISLIKKYFKPMISYSAFAKEWKYYWIVPGIFYLIWQYQINGSGETPLNIIMNPTNVVFLFIINIGAILIYQLMLRLDGQLVVNMELQQQKHYADIEALEYKLLEERIEEARRARHDIRHHMIVMADYLDAENYDGLKEYLNHYREVIPKNGAFSFCSHKTINSILLHFAHQAQKHEIDFQVQINIPEQLSIPDTDISILLGNLLENAIDACLECEDKKQIVIRGNADNNTIFFTIDNTCANEIKKNSKGHFISTKKKGSGIGIESVKNIVKRYNGVFTAEKKDDMFYVSFMLNI